MVSLNNIHTKKEFIKWLIAYHEFQNAACEDFFNYLLLHEDLIASIHFVNNAAKYPKGMIISTRYSVGPDFRFHKKDIVTNNVDTAFHELRLHPMEQMFIQVNLPYNPPSFFNHILEDRYFSYKYEEALLEDKVIAEKLLNKIAFNYQENQLRELINTALDTRDEKSFLILTSKLNKLLNNNNDI